MAGIFKEYLNKKLDMIGLQQELRSLIKKYNAHTGRFMFIYAAAMTRPNIDSSINQEDFFTIQDMLRDCPKDKIDFYIETPGGSGTAAEEIAKFLRKKFSVVNFVIAGEAKSAGTILALSGDNIYMAETGSLGPIDAQVKIGRFVVSAYDYINWLEDIKEKANSGIPVNEVDAIIISQISPGEVNGVLCALEFAKDLVTEWLPKYKFKNWSVRESTNEIVTQKYKEQRAKEVAEFFCNHAKWRQHSRSLKIEDIQHLLKIENIDGDPELADIIYRIKAILRILFDSTNIFKTFASADNQLNRTWLQSSPATKDVSPPGNGTKVDITQIEAQTTCPKCNTEHHFKGYACSDINVLRKYLENPSINKSKNFVDNSTLICDSCGLNINLDLLKNQIETDLKKQVIFK